MSDFSDSRFITKLDLPHRPKSVFAAISQEHGAIFLDSGNSSHQNSHYDIILCSPTFELVYENACTKITDNHSGNSEYKSGDPIKIAETIWQNNKPQQLAPKTFPFCGGLVGWFSYDLGRTIEKLPEIADVGFDCPELCVGIYDWALVFDNKTQLWYLLDYQPKLDRLNKLLTKIDNSAVQPTFSLTSAWAANMTFDEYRTKFNRVKHYLQSGDCYQINLAQRFEAHYQGSLWQAYTQLTAVNQAPFSAFIQSKNNTILCLSPERFIQLQQNKIETKPIKGTIARGKTQLEDEKQAEILASSSKDRAENLMIVDLLRNDISKVAKPKSVDVPSLFAIESFPAVHHLVSTVVGELAEDKSPFDLLRGAFPGGSITGAPKIRAMEIIEELEPHRRHIYCGSIGYIDWQNKMDTNICIRTLVASKDKLYCWAGGGLVMDSELESEYQETFHKVAKILPVLQPDTV
ncbi:aminodeoxychorismate synthase, component I [Saccharobesus litoralis]|uniref:aminodeoxychorismate synthase n=1 Tax=Saccharobesus litoralis TaxID=2172099 RepID=A0A2S0VUA0_9ALTE|nr:aminodeoxychorismate synthase component I [Saccharobesus litoralis]AWB67670.1 aminodeoxychorismate synthase, component I [Saccharobesus litoralis]